MTDAARDTSEPGWPAMTLAEVEAALCAPGAKFETEERVIRGVATRIWKNLPPTLGELARLVAAGYGPREFIVLEDQRITYDAWFRATCALARDLAASGVGKGDRVAVAMRNIPEWIVAVFAVNAIGAIAVPLNAWWTATEFEYGLSDSGSRMLICDEERLARVREKLADLPLIDRVIVCRATGALEGADPIEDIIGAPEDWADLPAGVLPDADVDPDDDATILYSSGTTGQPKGAILTHRSALTNILSAAYSSERAMLRRGETPPAETESKVLLLVIPLFHVTGFCAVLLGVMASGSKLVMMRKWDALEALKLIEAERVGITGGVPTIAWQLLEHPDFDKYDLSSLESVSYGGAPSAPELVRLIKAKIGALPGNGWGMTETSGTVTSHSAEDYMNRPDSAGPPVAVAELRIMSIDGARDLGVGEVGELWSKGPQMARGYWNKPEASAECFTEGWVHTGDLARLDEEGFLFIVDRAKDIIIRGGENIFSIEVENVLYDHPAVTDAALIGLPHRTLGEEPAAVVHLAPGESASEAELQAWVRERLAPFKSPVRIAFCAETLPRNANGKILKRELRERFFDEA
ncbi:MAG: acyl--CoA ligase [Sphingomonadaceae bacterium]|nr:acyl--CoA ligase [Sphingomonadaceae bacterium]